MQAMTLNQVKKLVSITGVRLEGAASRRFSGTAIPHATAATLESHSRLSGGISQRRKVQEIVNSHEPRAAP